MQPIPQGGTKVRKAETRVFVKLKELPQNITHGLGQKIPIGTPQNTPTGQTNIPFVQTAIFNSNSDQLTPQNVNHKASYDLPTILLANPQSVGIGGDY